MQIPEKATSQILSCQKVAYCELTSKPEYTKFERVHQDSILSVEGYLGLLLLPMLVRFQQQSEKAART